VIHSAAGGVGLLLTQIAKLRGAVVIGAVSTPAKAAVAAANGADHVAVYANGDLVDIAKRATGGRGVDVVYDAVGKDTFEQSLACLRVRGLLALYGEASGLVPPLDVRQLLTAGAVYLTRTGLSYYATTEAERRQRGDDVLRWLAEGKLKPRIDSTFSLKDAAQAHRAIEGRGTIGKVLLVPQQRKD
jgi:NADPH2:quinone reductase